MKFKVKKNDILLNTVIEEFGYASKTKAKQVFKNQQILVNGKITTNFNTACQVGDEIEFSKEKKVFKKEVKNPFEVYFEDEDYLVVSKPAKLLSVKLDSKKGRNLESILISHFRTLNDGSRVHLTQRLDRDTSGLILIAKSVQSFEAIQDYMSQIKKRYYAVIEGTPEKKEGQIQNQLEPNKAGVFYPSTNLKKSSLAITNYEVLKEFPNHSLVRINTETNTKDQIRSHFMTLKHPIIGDKKYKASGDPINRLGLHLFSLEFYHPIKGETIIAKTQVPKVFLKFGKHKSKDTL